MRTTNWILISSTIVLIGAFVAYLVKQSMGTKAGGGDSNNVAKEGSEQKNDEPTSGELQKAKTDLEKQSELLRENDTKISELNEELQKKNIRLLELLNNNTALAKMLACDSDSILETTQELLTGNAQLRQQLGRAQMALANQQQLALANSQKGNLVEEPTKENKTNPGLNAPANLNAQETGAGESQIVKNTKASFEPNVADSNVVEPKQNGRESNQTAKSSEAPKSLVAENERLQSKINQLVIELQNKEKILVRQYNLVKDLEQKVGKVETGLRSGSGATSTQGPFREIGTFKIGIDQ